MATILITGASTGIGFETALAFGRAGHKVAGAMRRPDRAPELARVAARENLDVTTITMDVDDDASVSHAVARVAHEIGPIDVLVNNAGIERMGSVEEVPLAEFRAVMETNYFGALRCIQAVLPSMRHARSGCIINVASVAGRLALSPMGPYTASKFALEALCECLAQEVKSFNVRVAIVEPGVIQTQMAERISVAEEPSEYPSRERMAALFQSLLANPTPASLVAAQILEIAQGGTWQLRHLVGPDAAPFIAWRQAMSDEEWVGLGALDDDAWYARIKADFGLDARPRA